MALEVGGFFVEWTERDFRLEAVRQWNHGTRDERSGVFCELLRRVFWVGSCGGQCSRELVVGGSKSSFG